MASSQMSQNPDRPLPQPSHGLADCVEHLFSGFAALVQANAVVLMKASADLDLPSIDARLCEILRHVRFLRNAAQPASRLPAELLGRIFHFVQLEFKNRREYAHGSSWDYRKMHEWMVLRLVCKRWEAVTAATPSLWTYIFLNNSHQDDLEIASLSLKSTPRLRLLQLFLHHSQQLGLSVHIGETLIHVTESLDEILPQLPRIRELTIIGEDSTAYSNLLEALGDTGTPMLQSLIYQPPSYNKKVGLAPPGAAPNLRSLSLRFGSADLPDNVKNLRQLHISDYDEGLDQLLNLLDSTPLLEDVLFTKLTLKDQPMPIPPRHLTILPQLKRLAFVDTNCKIIDDLLTNVSLPKTIFLASQHRHPYNRDLPGSLKSLDLLIENALAPYLRLTPIDRMSTKLHYWGYRCEVVQQFSLHMANDSFGMRLDIEFTHPRRLIKEQDFAAAAALNLVALTREVWIDRWCPDASQPRSSRYEEEIRECSTFYNFVRSSCGDIEGQKVKKLFCHGEAHEGILDGLTPNEYISHPTPVLSELHILTPPPADLQCLEKMEKMLVDRRAKDIPLDTIYFYLPLEEYSDDELSEWAVAFEQWEAWSPTRLANLVEKVEFVRTKTLPRMEVPSFCTEQSEGLWKWPTMWDNWYVSFS